MKKLFLVLIVLLILLPLSQIPQAKAYPDWLSGWDNRVKIEIDSGDIDANLTSFPVLIYLSNSSSGIYDEDVSFIFDKIGANSKKIAVTIGEDTETFIEIEKWDSVNEQAWLWANVTATSASNQTLYLYYDNDHADNTDYVDVTGTGNSTNVWDANFVMVQHMSQASTPIIDSTILSNDGTEVGTLNYEQTGQIGDAIDFVGADDHFTVARDSSIEPQTFTLECWFYADAYKNQALFTKDYTAHLAPYYSYHFYMKDPLDNDYWAAVVPLDYNFRNELSTVATYTTSTWTYTALTWDGTILSHYKNDAAAETNSKALTIAYHATDLYLGDARNIDQDFDGKLDEMRMSNVTRSAAWVKASYESGKDDLLDFGVEEGYIWTVTFYNSTGGILRRNNVTVANGTETEYANNTELELAALGEGNYTYSFMNFTWNGNYNITNPYNWTVVFNRTALLNITLWCYFRNIVAAPEEAFDGIMWLAVAGIIGVAMAAVFFKKRN